MAMQGVHGQRVNENPDYVGEAAASANKAKRLEKEGYSTGKDKGAAAKDKGAK